MLTNLIEKNILDQEAFPFFINQILITSLSFSWIMYFCRPNQHVPPRVNITCTYTNMHLSTVLVDFTHANDVPTMQATCQTGRCQLQTSALERSKSRDLEFRGEDVTPISFFPVEKI